MRYAVWTQRIHAARSNCYNVWNAAGMLWSWTNCQNVSNALISAHQWWAPSRLHAWFWSGRRDNSDYRNHIEGLTGGDDYAAMNQARVRTFHRLNVVEEATDSIAELNGVNGQIKEPGRYWAELI